MNTLALSLTVECPHSNKKRLSVHTEPSDELRWTQVWFRVCDGCAALAERAGFDFEEYPDLTDPGETYVKENKDPRAIND